MKPFGIITDGTVQFTNSSFLGRGIVEVIPLEIILNGNVLSKEGESTINKLPKAINESNKPQVVLPSRKRLLSYIDLFLETYNELFFILASKSIVGFYSSTYDFIKRHPERGKITLIDSKTISIGLGYLVQMCAEIISTKLFDKNELIYRIRKIISKIYSLLCIPCHSYLSNFGIIDRAQYLNLEMNNLIPIFSIDNGKLSPHDKVKSYRNCYSIIKEFIDEFDDLDQIGFMWGIPARFKENISIKKHCQELFPSTTYSSFSSNIILSALFGPKTISVFLMEK
jgi:DegV family protein with EDD domain